MPDCYNRFVQSGNLPNYRNQNRFALRYWPTYPGLLIIWLLSWLPLPLLRFLGGALGALVFLLFGSRRRITLINLSKCFPDLSASKIRKIDLRHFMELGASILSTGINWHASSKRLNRLFTIKGQEHLDLAIANKQNVILLAPHFVALEIGGIYLSKLYPTISMYQYAKNKVMDMAIRNGRSRFGIELVERKAPLRQLIKKIRSGKLFYYLPDQDPGPVTGVFVPFFGQIAATFPMLGKFSQLTNAAVIPCMTIQKSLGKGYEITLFPPLANYPSGGELEDTRRMNSAIEDLVSTRPEQYFWVHKRFKTRPEGSKSLY